MKVALLADGDWLAQERGLLRRLVVGLVDESVKVVRVTPEGEADAAGGGLLAAEQLRFRPTPWGWARDRRLGSLRGPLREMKVDLVHALDATLRRAAGDLGEVLDVPVVCSVWSEASIARLEGDGGGPTIAYAAASRGLAEAVRRIVGTGRAVETVPPGVFITEETEARPLENVGESLCCIVVGDGRFDPHYQALLDAMTRVRERIAGAMYFFHSVDSDQHQLWRAVEQRGLLNQVSLVPAGADARQLLVQADAVLVPQAMRAVRTVVLESMAASRPVLAVADPMADYFVDGTTAHIVTRVNADGWAACLESLAAEPQSFARLGASARRFVADHYKTSSYVSRMKQLYERLAEPDPIPFGTA